MRFTIAFVHPCITNTQSKRARVRTRPEGASSLRQRGRARVLAACVWVCVCGRKAKAKGLGMMVKLSIFQTFKSWFQPWRLLRITTGFSLLFHASAFFHTNQIYFTSKSIIIQTFQLCFCGFGYVFLFFFINNPRQLLVSTCRKINYQTLWTSASCVTESIKPASKLHYCCLVRHFLRMTQMILINKSHERQNQQLIFLNSLQPLFLMFGTLKLTHL